MEQLPFEVIHGITVSRRNPRWIDFTENSAHLEAQLLRSQPLGFESNVVGSI